MGEGIAGDYTKATGSYTLRPLACGITHNIYIFSTVRLLPCVPVCMLTLATGITYHIGILTPLAKGFNIMVILASWLRTYAESCNIMVILASWLYMPKATASWLLCIDILVLYAKGFVRHYSYLLSFVLCTVCTFGENK